MFWQLSDVFGRAIGLDRVVIDVAKKEPFDLGIRNSSPPGRVQIILSEDSLWRPLVWRISLVLLFSVVNDFRLKVETEIAILSVEHEAPLIPDGDVVVVSILTHENPKVLRPHNK